MFYIQTCLIIFWYTYRYSIIRANRMELSKKYGKITVFIDQLNDGSSTRHRLRLNKWLLFWDVFPVCLRYMRSEDKPHVKSGCLCFFRLPLQLVGLRFRLLWLLHLKRTISQQQQRVHRYAFSFAYVSKQRLGKWLAVVTLFLGKR